MYEEITALDFKKKLGVPLDYNFLGWAVHYTSKDEFLIFYKDDLSSKGWSGNPQHSLKFGSQKDSDDLILKLGVCDTAESVAVFDLDDNILIACND